METTLYALQHKLDKFLMSYEESDQAYSNVDGEGSVIEYKLDYCKNPKEGSIWYAGSPEHAEYVRINNTPYYNASITIPMHYDNYDPDNFEVVKVVIVKTVEVVAVNIPTAQEFYEKTGNKQHLDSFKHGRVKPMYMIWELCKYLGRDINTETTNF